MGGGLRLSGVCAEVARLDFLRWLSAAGCEAARFRRCGAPPAAISTACAEGLRKRCERFGGILDSAKEHEKTPQTLPKQNYDN